MNPDDLDLLTAFENAPMGVAVAAPDGVVLACNPALGRLLGRDPAHVVGRVLHDEVVHPDDLDTVRRFRALMLAGRTRLVRHECRWVVGGGRVAWVMVSVAKAPGDGDRLDRAVIHVEDITERKQREAELHHRALHDALTGLANRVLLLERIRDALAHHDRHARPSQLFYLDLNGFKAVNDRFGHAAGDAVLTQLARRIVAVLREGDTAARVGGDEFVVLCDGIDPRHTASVAERLRAAAARPFLVDGVEIVLSAAVGSYPVHLADPLALLREADRRMYESKPHAPSTAPAP